MAENAVQEYRVFVIVLFGKNHDGMMMVGNLLYQNNPTEFLE